MNITTVPLFTLVCMVMLILIYKWHIRQSYSMCYNVKNEDSRIIFHDLKKEKSIGPFEFRGEYVRDLSVSMKLMVWSFEFGGRSNNSVRHRLVASLFVAILELAVISAKNVVEGKTTVFDERMVFLHTWQRNTSETESFNKRHWCKVCRMIKNEIMIFFSEIVVNNRSQFNDLSRQKAEWIVKRNQRRT